MAATARQIFIYNFHVSVCNRLGIVQSTVRHKALQGSTSVPSTKGNVIYTGAGPDLRDQTLTTDSLVWAVWEPLRQRGDRGDDAEPGRTSVPYLRGQCPLIDDSFNQVSLTQDDWLEDGQGRIYRVDNPTMSNDLAFWAFSLEFYR
jgi:hypothetical protein